MQFEQHESEEIRARIYDPAILHEVMSLAHDLQNRHQGKLTLTEIEGIGAELGLAPQYVREAVARVSGKRRTPVLTADEPLPVWHARALIGIPLIWGLFTLLAGDHPPDFLVFSLVAGGPALLSLLFGYLARSRSRGIVASLAVLVAMAAGVVFSQGHGSTGDAVFGVGTYVVCASPIAAGLACAGDWLRRWRSERSGRRSAAVRPDLPFPAPPAG